MPDVRFCFVGSRAGQDARLAAAILADCLRRQGQRAMAAETCVQVDIPDLPRGQPERVYVLHDEALLHDPALLMELDGRTAVIVSTARPAAVLRHELARFTAGVVTVDADGIALDAGADQVVAMLGAAARAIPGIDHDALSASVWHAYDRQLPYAAHAAIRAFDLAYSQAQLAQ